ncbi:LacI family DNA-binding transcriptional regulator [Trueperella sp.]|uniref:LacI family DNA-binding transcriptional regulator n=1 Tax=Trueperella sp. TaxID=2699835 RepID=UPI00261B852A|nr:LacI family DNA-binding transcriptional regulator [Trueperella sp.]
MPRKKTSTVTLADVATRSGFSTSTVSRVFNDSEAVRPASRDRIMAAAHELGYRPNLSARALASGHTHMIGLVVVGNISHGAAELVAALEDEFRRRGYRMLLATVSPSSAKDMGVAIEQMRSSQIEALVAVLGSSATFVSALEAWGDGLVPTVLVCASDIGVSRASIRGFDQMSGIRSAVEHLHDQRIGAILHVTGDLRFDDASVRLSAFMAACHTYGIAATWTNSGGWSAQDGYDVGKKIAASELPRAIIAGNDTLAVGMMRALREKGLNAGTDYAIIGFDDNPISGFLDVTLTTIKQNYALMSDSIFNEVFSLVQGGEPTVAFLDTPLIVRESSVLGS